MDGDGGHDEAHDEPYIDRLRAIAMVLPEATEVVVLGSPTFRVATRPFAVFERSGGVPVVRVKLDLVDQATLVQVPGFEPAPDTGHHGWTNIRLDLGVAWDEVDRLVIESYRRQAPEELRARLDGMLEAAGEEPVDDEGPPVDVDLTPAAVAPRTLRIMTLPGAGAEEVLAAERAWRDVTEGRRTRSRVTVAEGEVGVVVTIEHATAADRVADDALPETADLVGLWAGLATGPVEVTDVELRHTDVR